MVAVCFNPQQKRSRLLGTHAFGMVPPPPPPSRRAACAQPALSYLRLVNGVDEHGGLGCLEGVCNGARAGVHLRGALSLGEGGLAERRVGDVGRVRNAHALSINSRCGVATLVDLKRLLQRGRASLRCGGKEEEKHEMSFRQSKGGAQRDEGGTGTN